MAKIVTVFLQMSSTAHPGVEKLLLSEVREVESAVAVPVFPLSDLVPGDLTEVFRYSGSLTTPPCSQIVEVRLLVRQSSVFYIYFLTCSGPSSRHQWISLSNRWTDLENCSHREIILLVDMYLKYPRLTFYFLVNNYRPIQSLNSRKVETAKTEQNLWVSTRHPSSSTSSTSCSSSSSSSSSSSLHVTVTLLLICCVSVLLGNNN